MNNNHETFGECLTKLIEIFKLRSSVLARGINVDSSLVYKWLRNERVPSYKSPYLSLITEFLAGCIKNSYQLESIIAALSDEGYDVSAEDDGSITEALTEMLSEAQGYTLECHTREKQQPKNDIPTGNLFTCSGSDNTRILKGTKALLYAGLELIKSAPETPCPGQDIIYITANNDFDITPEYEEIYSQWKYAINNVLKNGWKVVCLIRVNSDVKKAVRLVEQMELSLPKGGYSVYYHKKKATIYTINEIVIVPQAGAMLCISSESRNKVDTAFYFKSPESIDALTGHFLQYLTSAQPLLKSFPSKDTLDFQNMFADIDERQGIRYAFKGNLSTMTLPPELYNKYLLSSGKSYKEIAERKYLHKRRYDAFINQIAYYKSREIWVKENLEDIFNRKCYAIDEYYLFENSYPETGDIVSRFETLIEMLEKYDNYEVALVSRCDYPQHSNFHWMVKENYGVFIEACMPDSSAEGEQTGHCSKINHLITRKEAVDAFQYHYMNIWDSIPPENKDKRFVISWLRALVSKNSCTLV